MKFRTSALSDIGCYRSENEDFHLCDDELGLYAVADGIGGLPGGAQASRRALSTFAAWLRTQRRVSLPHYADGLRLTNKAVFDLGHEISPRHGIGTTLTLAHIAHDVLHIVHVGDSSLFRLRADDIEMLTQEHNVENELKSRAARGEPVDFSHENRAALTRCVGQPPPLEGEMSTHPIEPGDRYLVCTDGITRCITPHEIARHLRRNDDPTEAAALLVELARERGGLDNATVVVIYAD